MAPGHDQVLRSGDERVSLVPDRSRPRAYTLEVGRTEQSYVDLDDPLHLEFDYVQRMADALNCLIAPGTRLRIVHIGGAGLTLPRYVAATRPQSAQVVLEPEIELTAFVREHLPLPRQSGIKVRGVDGRAGVAELRPGSWDVVVVDAFLGAQVPAELGTAEFFADVRRVLAPGGTVMMNLTDRAPFGYGGRVLTGLRTQFPQVLLSTEPATLKGRRFGNVLVLGSAAPLPALALAELAGRGPFPYRVVHGERLAQLIGGSLPFTDADAERSPEPPHGAAHFS